MAVSSVPAVLLVIAMVLRVPLQREILVTDVNGEEFARPLFLSFVSRMSCSVGIVDLKWTKASIQKAAQLVVFGVLDLLASILFCFGVQFIHSSYAALLASSNTVFSAIATAAFFRRLTAKEVTGVICVLIGIVATFIAAVNEEDEMDMADPRRLGVSSNSAALGMVLVVLAYCTWAAELLLCEKRFGNDPELTPQLVMGVVGLVGVFGYSVVLFPVLAHAPEPFREDVRDMPELLGSSRQLEMMLVAFFVVLVVHSYLAYAVAKTCSALTLSMLRVVVGPLTWALGVGLTAAGLADTSGAGEKLSFPASAIEACGALLCFAGLHVYLTGAAPESAEYSTVREIPDIVGASTGEEPVKVSSKSNGQRALESELQTPTCTPILDSLAESGPKPEFWSDLT
jgi:drug/metabolite transporter (DMT)-like permease